MNLFNYAFSLSKTQRAINSASPQKNRNELIRLSSPEFSRSTYIKYQKNKYVEWHRYYSNSGKPFYYSPITHETQWEEPLYNSIIFDTNSPSFTANDCVVINPPTLECSGCERMESVVNTRRIPSKSNNITKNIYKNKNIPPKFGFTLQHFEEIIVKNVEKSFNNGIDNSLPQYKLYSGEIIAGVQYKSDLDIMEEGYWLNSFD